MTSYFSNPRTRFLWFCGILILTALIITKWFTQSVVLASSLILLALSSLYYGNTHICVFRLSCCISVDREKNPYLFYLIVAVYLIISLFVMWKVIVIKR
jgi:hypothetical protein